MQCEVIAKYDVCISNKPEYPPNKGNEVVEKLYLIFLTDDLQHAIINSLKSSLSHECTHEVTAHQSRRN